MPNGNTVVAVRRSRRRGCQWIGLGSRWSIPLHPASALNRYGINDRTPVTYNADGSLELLLQPEAPKDEEPLKANWLPTGQGGFHLFLRIYCPDRARIDGGWKAPSLIPTSE